MRRIANVLDLYHGDNLGRLPDFAAVKAAGCFAIIHKATQGSHWRDPVYKERKKAAQDAGLLWGAYHFCDASDVAGQVENFLSHAEYEPHTDSVRIMLAADFEDEPSGHSMALHQLVSFLKLVAQQAIGCSPVIYSGNRIREKLTPPRGRVAQDMANVMTFFRNHRLWLAEYGPHENIPWPWNVKDAGGKSPGAWLWQFSESGHYAHIIGKVDESFFDGDLDQLTKNWVA